MTNARIVTAGAGILAAVGISLGAAGLATASDTSAVASTSSPTPSATDAPGSGGPRGGGPGGASAHTPVTGDELDTVTATVKAKDSTVTVESVRKDPDGSYDVFGTKDGAPLMLQVSKDLKTITTNTGGRGPGAPDDGSSTAGTSAPTT